MALYALCRVLDDIADAPDIPPAQKLAMLDHWQHHIEVFLASGQSAEPLLARLAPWQHQGALEPGCFSPLLEGLRMDVQGRMIAPTFAVLEHYCFCVAGSVGICAIRMMGDRSDMAAHYAQLLGQALQRTNILRDIKEDRQMGRLYLPQEVLAAYQLDASSLLNHEAILPDQRLAPVLRYVGQQASEYYAQAQALAKAHPMPACALMMADIYRRLHENMAHDQWQQKRRRLGGRDWWWLAGRLMAYQAT